MSGGQREEGRQGPTHHGEYKPDAQASEFRVTRSLACASGLYYTRFYFTVALPNYGTTLNDASVLARAHVATDQFEILSTA